jgi:hypothetical protein
VTRAQRAVITADRALHAAQERLSAAVKRAYPIGARVRVEIGRATVYGTVIGHGPSWSRPEDVDIENNATGKIRTFSATYTRCNPQVIT